MGATSRELWRDFFEEAFHLGLALLEVGSVCVENDVGGAGCFVGLNDLSDFFRGAAAGAASARGAVVWGVEEFEDDADRNAKVVRAAGVA